MNSIIFNEKELKYWKKKSDLINDLADSNTKSFTLTKKLLFGNNTEYFTNEDWAFLRILFNINVDWAESHSINDIIDDVVQEVKASTDISYPKVRAKTILDFIMHADESVLNGNTRRRITGKTTTTATATATAARGRSPRYNNNWYQNNVYNNNNNNNGVSKKYKKHPKSNVRINNNNNNNKNKTRKTKGKRRY